MTDLLATLGKAFPSPREVGRLKATLFGNVEGSLLRIASDSVVLHELAVTKYHQAFDAKTLNIEPRVQRLWTKHPSSAQQVLLRLLSEEVNPIGERIVSILLDAVDGGVALNALLDRPALFFDVVRRKPKFATLPSLWQANPRLQEESLNILTESLGNREKSWRPIIRAMVKSDSDVIASAVAQNLGEVGVSALLNWANEASDFDSGLLNWSWRQVLRKNARHVESWLKDCAMPRTGVVATVVEIFPPRAFSVRHTGEEVWTRIAKEASPSTLEAKKYAELMAFVLSLGFAAQDGKKLIIPSFQPVHDAVSKSLVGWKSWSRLEKEFPSLSQSLWDKVWGWDRCEKLRRALVVQWLRGEWPVDELLETVPRTETFSQVVNLLSISKDGRKRIDRLQREVKVGKASATAEQKKVLRELSRLR